MSIPTRTSRAPSNGSSRHRRNRLGLLAVAVLATACSVQAQPGPDYDAARERLVQSLTKPIFGRTVIDSQPVLEALRAVPRHAFVPKEQRQNAYVDSPLPIGHDQTISQPYIVAFMTQLLEPQATDVVLEIGTGSGYQAAVLAEIVERVYTIEIVDELGRRAEADLERLGYGNVTGRIGDGYKGWPEHAPFDKVIVTAAPDHVPQPLVDQLKPGGQMVIPVGPEAATQELLLITKSDDGSVSEERVELVRFVPMTGEARDH